MNCGYVKIYRKIIDSGLLGNAEACQLFMFLMVKATYKPRKYMVGTQIIELQPGQFFAGRKQLACELNSTEQKIRTALNILKKNEIITQQASSKGTIITIINWCKYQDEKTALFENSQKNSENDDFSNQQLTSTSTSQKQEVSTLSGHEQPAANQHFNQQLTSSQPAVNQRLTTKQESKNISKKEKEEEYSLRSYSPPEQQVAAVEQNINALAPIHCLELNTGEKHPITQGEIDQWQDLYPAVDVLQELRNMTGWLLGNPKKRKTKSGINRFIHGWLADKQNKGGGSRASPAYGNNALPAVRPVAHTQFQKGRQDMEDMADLVLRGRAAKAAKEEDYGITGSNYDGAWEPCNALPPAT